MRILATIMFAALICAAPGATRAEETGETLSEAITKASEDPAEDGKKPAARQPAKKGVKKPARRKKAKPVSEYKFKSDTVTPTYKFDKNADPIVKPSKKKKGAKGSGTGTASGQKPKLQPVKSFADQNKAQEGGMPDLGGIQLPPGMNIPGMGGK